MTPRATSHLAPAERILEACKVLASFSETEEGLTRTYLSPPFHQAHAYLKEWMDRLGMESRVDAIGNLRGVLRFGEAGAPRLLIGSHIDTVPNAGAYDGVLGVVMALALIEELAKPSSDRFLDYNIEAVAFSEEEGIRFAMPFLGSRALLGEIDEEFLQKTDARGVTLAEAIQAFGLSPGEIGDAALHPATRAFLEFHIEQGPVLEDLGVGLGVVEAIAGQSRCELVFRGMANHAGTTPMHLRKDALAGASRWIGAVERRARQTPGLVATVGRIHAKPDAANVIPGEARLSLDIRHATDAVRLGTLAYLLENAKQIATLRGLAVEIVEQLHQPATTMDGALADALHAASLATGTRPCRMIGGAGHDAMILAKRVPAAMLFLRSPGGVSHHPGESVRVEDAQAAFDAGLYFLKRLDAASLLALRR